MLQTRLPSRPWSWPYVFLVGLSQPASPLVLSAALWADRMGAAILFTAEAEGMRWQAHITRLWRSWRRILPFSRRACPERVIPDPCIWVDMSTWYSQSPQERSRGVVMTAVTWIGKASSRTEPFPVLTPAKRAIPSWAEEASAAGTKVCLTRPAFHLLMADPRVVYVYCFNSPDPRRVCFVLL